MGSTKKALIAMSGGVDSSVAAAITKGLGYDCIGVTMRLSPYGDESAENGTCCSQDDINDAKRVADGLDFPHHVFNFTDNFDKQVIRRFVETYKNGGTPNPCVDCNRYIKFGHLFSNLSELDCDYIVTGHYARIEKDEQSGRYLLKKARNESKDQSYFLYSFTQEQLAHTLLPLGEFESKEEVRELAEKHGFTNARKHDSQDICFVRDGDYAKFIENYTGEYFPVGNFIDKDGNVLGKHSGIIHYTVGQRKGLGIALGKPAYVCDINSQSNTVTLTDNDGLYSDTLTAKDINLISCDKIEGELKVLAKIRYRQPAQLATVYQLDGDTLKIVFDRPQRAIARGQSVVLYDGDTVIGGGIIQ